MLDSLLSLLGVCFTYTILFHCVCQNINQSRIMYKTKLRQKSMKNPSALKTFVWGPVCTVMHFLWSCTCKILQSGLLVLYRRSVDILLCSSLHIKRQLNDGLIVYLTIPKISKSWIPFDLGLLSRILSCLF